MKNKMIIAETLQNIAKKSANITVNRCWFPGIHEIEPSENLIKWVKNSSEEEENSSKSHK